MKGKKQSWNFFSRRSGTFKYN